MVVCEDVVVLVRVVRDCTFLLRWRAASAASLTAARVPPQLAGVAIRLADPGVASPTGHALLQPVVTLSPPSAALTPFITTTVCLLLYPALVLQTRVTNNLSK